MVIGDLELSNELDRDGDMRIDLMTAHPLIWVDKDEASRIVEHLTRVFRLDKEG